LKIVGVYSPHVLQIKESQAHVLFDCSFAKEVKDGIFFLGLTLDFHQDPLLVCYNGWWIWRRICSWTV